MSKDTAPAKAIVAAKPAAPKVQLTLPEGVPAYWAEACRQLMRRDRVLKRLIPLLSSQARRASSVGMKPLPRWHVPSWVSRLPSNRPRRCGTSFPGCWRDKARASAQAQGGRYACCGAVGAQGGLSGRSGAALHGKPFAHGRVGADGDDAIIAELMAIRGLSRWTAENFLIYYLARPNAAAR